MKSYCLNTYRLLVKSLTIDAQSERSSLVTGELKRFGKLRKKKKQVRKISWGKCSPLLFYYLLISVQLEINTAETLLFSSPEDPMNTKVHET